MVQKTEYFGHYRDSQLRCEVTLTSRMVQSRGMVRVDNRQIGQKQYALNHLIWGI